MPRFLKVRGKPGCIVGHPWADGQRYVGKTPKVFPPDHKPDPSMSKVDLFDDCEEVIRDEAAERAVRNAIASGHLELLAEGTGKDPESVTWDKTYGPTAAVPEKTATKKGG